ncbi:hypothetical protein C8F04DRAFT_1268209 [Mycena alexandri]|uniref:Uncharacterized protein n=1 Tax=Mycena alexandri TaxID=1745969 RepID=A0AAD6WVF8_9AGAR|nr:hypothetical protein C8F04DRAFT_1268209 [Mycena alexandri]
MEEGVQRMIVLADHSADLRTAIKNSWVLIDVTKEQDWPKASPWKSARAVIWTSSPHRLRQEFFVKYFWAELWFMKPWSAREIWAVAEVLVSALKNPGHHHASDLALGLIQIFYCIVGVVEDRVRDLMRQAVPTPQNLRDLDETQRIAALAVKNPLSTGQITRQSATRFTVWRDSGK